MSIRKLSRITIHLTEDPEVEKHCYMFLDEEVKEVGDGFQHLGAEWTLNRIGDGNFVVIVPEERVLR